MIKTVVKSGIAIGFAIFAARQLVYGGRDLARYNKMRDMSGEAPLGAPAAHRKPETNAKARTTNPFVMLASIPSDLSRYLKLKSM